MSSAGALLLTISLTTSVVGSDKLMLPGAVIEAGLAKAGCTIPPAEARIIGTERLSGRLGIVEVICWRAAHNAGSILFAVPEHRPEQAQLLAVESWQDGRIQRSYSVSSPGYDPKTRTLSSSHKARGAGDCGTIQEMKWTGWHFRLLNVWSKDHCDGEPFEWDSRDRWQVFPKQVSPGRGLEAEGSVSGRDGAQSSR